jgi:hypothetical protein
MTRALASANSIRSVRIPHASRLARDFDSRRLNNDLLAALPARDRL